MAPLRSSARSGDDARLAEATAPLRSDPRRAAILLDVDGTLAPIVRHAEDAMVPEATRGLLIALARRYELIACVSGRRAADARRMVAIGSIAYVGNHGGELLLPGGERQEDPGFAHWRGRVQAFCADVDEHALQRLRVRQEDKGAIVAFHWRGAPDEEAARVAVVELAEHAQTAGLATHWGRKVLEVRPPVAMTKAVGVANLLRSADLDVALYAGDDATDLDAFRGLTELVDGGHLAQAVRVGVRSDEGPAEIEREADLVVDGTDGVRDLLLALMAA